MNKKKLCLIGFLQAIGVAGYCTLVAGLLRNLEKFSDTKPEFGIAVFMLTLIVFSVAVVGSLVFGYPAYLALNQRVKEALILVACALFWILIIIFSIAAVILALD